MASYLVFFFPSATAPASAVACISYEVVNVSGHVTSQTSERSDFQGAILTPSDIFTIDNNYVIRVGVEEIPAAIVKDGVHASCSVGHRFT